MNALAANQTSINSDLPCPDLITMAEQELSAFFTAITHLFGSKQAELSAEDWLRELIEDEGLPSSISEWRLITAKASNRLARRGGASSSLVEVQMAS